MERTSKASAATAFYLTAALNQLFGNVTPQSLWVSEVTPFDFGNAYSFFRYATQTLKIMRHARARGLSTIIITDSVIAPPAHFGDIVLLAATASIHFCRRRRQASA
jgi:DNA-binding MurR/RpiR family transcriptional regulator